MAKRVMGVFWNDSSVLGIINRSGETYNSRTSPARMRFQVAAFSKLLLWLFMVSAATPASCKAVTWSSMSATRGETTTVRPPSTKAGI